MRDLGELKERVRAFCAERDWDRFHNPKNLAMALSVEASELVELFQWLTEEQSVKLDEKQRGRVAEELADVLWFLVRISDRLGIDLLEAADTKLVPEREEIPCRPRARRPPKIQRILIPLPGTVPFESGRTPAFKGGLSPSLTAATSQRQRFFPS